MANETLLTNVAGIVDDIAGESIFIFNQHAGILDCVVHVSTQGEQGVTLDFPKWGTVASSAVAQTAENTDLSTNTQITVADAAALVDEHVIMAVISDKALMGAKPRNLIVESTSRLFADAMLAKLEDDITVLFSAFLSGNDLAGAATTMTEAHWFQAIQQAKAAKADVNNLCAVLSPKQIWGAKGLRPLLVSLKLDSGELGEEMKNRGFVGKAFNIDILVSNEIDEDVASGGDAAGVIMDKRAIGVHSKGFMNIEFERNASLRAFELVMTGMWKEVEIHDTFGNYFLSDVA